MAARLGGLKQEKLFTHLSVIALSFLSLTAMLEFWYIYILLVETTLEQPSLSLYYCKPVNYHQKILSRSTQK